MTRFAESAAVQVRTDLRRPPPTSLQTSGPNSRPRLTNRSKQVSIDYIWRTYRPPPIARQLVQLDGHAAPTDCEATMPVFHDADDVYRHLGGLFEYVVADESLGELAVTSGLVARLQLTDPDCVLVADFPG